MYLRLAWRNIWRNKRRTLITTASIFTAVILAVLMRSLQLGSYERMIDNVVSFYTGHIQLHHQGYWEEQTIDNSFVPNDTIYTRLRQTKEITGFVPRLESFALASAKEMTKGAMVVGIAPEGESKVTRLKEKIVAGSYLTDHEHAALLSEGLANYLRLGVGDTLVLLGQGYHGASAAGMFPIKGLVKFPSPELNQRMVYLPIEQARQLYSADNRATSIVVSIDESKDAAVVAKELRVFFADMPVQIMDWREMLPDLVQLIEVDNAGGMITISILYMIIGFGIFGTILMMLTERTREFGILIAIGMKRMRLIGVVTMEILMISGLGILLGVGLGIPIVSYFHFHPIHVSGEMAQAYERFGMEPVFPFSTASSIFYSQALVVLAITLLLAFYPWFRLRRLATIDALKS